MTYYHGSPIGGLTELNPFLSEHGKPYIYLATNPLVALLYAVKPVPKPFSFYPYGFDSEGNVIYSEYYENAFYDIYKGKIGFLYECHDVANLENPTQINCAYTSTDSIKIDGVTQIADIYEYFMKQKQKGAFKIKAYHDVPTKELQYAEQHMNEMMKQHQLKSTPEHPMSLWIQTHFPKVWEIG